jgi:integral membrane sensor domain MASE1
MTAVANSKQLPRYAATGLRICATAGAYYAAGRLGLLQELVKQITPLWLPTGIALVSLLWWGLRVWPGITLGAFLVNIWLGPSVPAVLAMATGTTLAAVCAYLLLRRVGFRTELDRLRDALALVFLGALIGMLVSSTVGSSVFVLAGAVPLDGFWPLWSVWWTGDAMGILVGAPFLLVLRRARWPRDVQPHRWAEVGALLLGTAIVTLVVTRSTVSLLFLTFPFLVWAAFRFQLAGAAPCALIVSVVTILAAADGAGPFAGHDLFAQMLTLQAFNGTAAMTALLLSAVVTERNRTHEQISQVCRQLAEVVVRLTPDEDPEGRLPPGLRKRNNQRKEPERPG